MPSSAVSRGTRGSSCLVLKFLFKLNFKASFSVVSIFFDSGDVFMFRVGCIVGSFLKVEYLANDIVSSSTNFLSLNREVVLAFVKFSALLREEHTSKRLTAVDMSRGRIMVRFL